MFRKHQIEFLFPQNLKPQLPLKDFSKIFDNLVTEQRH